MQHSSITTSGDTGQSNLPEEATMFEQLFTQSATIAHRHSSPYATERRQYLSHLMEEGRSRNSLRIIAELLMSYAQHLPLHRADVCVSDIKVSADMSPSTQRTFTQRSIYSERLISSSIPTPSTQRIPNTSAGKTIHPCSPSSAPYEQLCCVRRAQSCIFSGDEPPTQHYFQLNITLATLLPVETAHG
jgi:hypothetical protein